MPRFVPPRPWTWDAYESLREREGEPLARRPTRLPAPGDGGFVVIGLAGFAVVIVVVAVALCH